MNIIFLSQKRKKRLTVTLHPMVCIGLFSFFCCAIFMVYQSGYRHASEETADMVRTTRTQTQAVWQAELTQELSSLRTIKQRAEKSLSAMAGRLSLLQGHVMRLDALGARLAVMADLEEIDFAIENPPGMGGPEAPVVASSRQISDFIKSLSHLEESLLNRQDKLLAMESMLIDRNLQERTLPAGVPTEQGWLSSLYGYRADPMTGNREFHQGVDYAGKPGTPIIAVAAGIVTWSGDQHGYGNLVEINHGNGLATRYAHNVKNLVIVGEKVDKGEVIALMGDSGRTTGTHLHFEVLKNGKHINPKQYLSLR